jgi:hypothetical protein
MPCTPERVWRAIQNSGGGSAGDGGGRATGGTVAYGGSAIDDLGDTEALREGDSR